MNRPYLEADGAPEAPVVGEVPPHPADPGGREPLVRRQHPEDVQHGGVGAAQVRREVIPEGGRGRLGRLLRLAVVVLRA